MNTGRVFAKWLLAAGLIGVLTSCGGGGTGGGTPPPPPPAQLTVITTVLPNAMQDTDYSELVKASGGTPPYTWSLSSGALPPGLTLGTDGKISGRSTYSGPFYNYSFIARVADSAGRTASSNWIGINAIGKLVVSTTALQAGNIGVPYSQYISINGGTPPYTIAIAPGTNALPAGLSFNYQWVQGTPTVSGTFDLTFQVTDSGATAQTTTQTIALVIGNNLAMTQTTIPLGVQGFPYAAPLTALGGTPPYSWSVSPGYSQLPQGLAFSGDGTISGTPTVNGSFGTQVQVTDSSQPVQTAVRWIWINLNPQLSWATTTMNDAVQNSGYNGGVSAQDGMPPYTVTLESGSLPPGINWNLGYNGNISLSGIPTTLGTYTFTVKAIDSLQTPETITQTVTLRVNTKLQPDQSPLPAGIVGQPYSYQFTATGGVLPYIWQGTFSLDGANIDPNTGILTVTPTAPYDNSLYIYLRDSSNPPQYSWMYPHLKIADILKIKTSSFPAVSVNSSLNLQPVFTGGVGPFSWSISSGSLPNGVSVGSDGTITGKASVAGTYPFTLTLSDAGPPAQTASVPLVLDVKSSAGRNNSIATATQLSNGTYDASISPVVDPGTGLLSPDIDYYKISADPGSVVWIEIFADRLTPASPMDSVLEIVDANGARLQYCAPYGGNEPYNYVQPCMADDFADGSTRDSRLFLMFPSTLAGPQTFYVKVLDWRGTARPDFQYQLKVSGVD